MPKWNKTSTISILPIIKNTCNNSVSKQMIACLRGIIDNGFYLFVGKGDRILGAWFASKSLVLDLHKYLPELGIKSKINIDTKYFDKRVKKFITRHSIRIRRKEDIKKWFNIIGTNNPKLYKKYNNMLIKLG